MGVGKTNMRKGSLAEQYYIQFFRNLGFSSCEASKIASKKHDNAKIDLINLPFNVQIKAGRQRGMNPGKELFMMESAIKMMFPEEDEVFTKPLLLFHYEDGEPGTFRTPEQEMVYMSMLQFDIFRSKSPNIEYIYMKTFKFELNSEFKTVVGMTIDVFKNEIILKHYRDASHSNTTK